MSISFRNPFDKKLVDKGYQVFDFVEIGPISKAPIISKDGGRVSKTLSRKDDKDLSTSTKKNEAKQKDKSDNKKQDKATSKEKVVNIKSKAQKNKKTENKKKQEEKKSTSKKSDKAVVDLKKNNQKSKQTNEKAAKKSFDSLLSSISADGDHENHGINAEEVGETLTATQVDLIRSTIKKCWHVLGGLKNAQDLVVDVELELSQDGTVQKADIVDKARLASDPDFKVAAENARRAVLDPNCNPLPLPKEKYNEWKSLELSFNPKDMF